MLNIYEVQSANKRKSVVIIGLFIVFITLSVYFISQGLGIYLGYEPGGLGFAGIALIISGFLSFGSYWFSDKIVLSISGAKKADKKNYLTYYSVVENLCLAYQLPMPSLYIIDDTATNAFATGRNPDHAVVCVTTGILDKLTRSELEGVIGHELTHIKNYDILLMSTVAVLVGTVALLGDWLFRMSWYSSRGRDRDKGQLGAILMLVGIVFAILSPIIGRLIQLAISRRREFMADAGSVYVTRQPDGLIKALEKISSDHEILEAANKATAHLYIINPFKAGSHRTVDWFAGLFNTHPSIRERIETLQKMT